MAMFSSLDTVVCPNWFFVAMVMVAMAYFSSIVSPPLICNNQKECVFIIGSTHHTQERDLLFLFAKIPIY